MREFLDVAELIRERLEAVSLQEHFNLVFKAIAELQSVFAKSNIDIDNIEAVFAAFEMAKLFRRLGRLNDMELSNLTTAIKSLIVTTLEATLKCRIVDERVQPPQPYGPFAELIRDMTTTATPVTVMTFNYDVAVDFAFYSRSISFDYCYSSMNSSAGVPLLKLHGSLNWTRCSHCKVIQFVPVSTCLEGKRFEILGRTEIELPISQYLPQCAQCGKTSNPEPLIVPPTWNKTQHYAEIANVWSLAAQKLSEADNIVVIGYSLPDTDQFFHYLYALGSVGPTRLKRFWILNPDPNILSRFERLLGPLARERVKVDNVSFGQGISKLRQEFVRK